MHLQKKDIDNIKKIIEKFQKLNVLIIGESIIDEFIFVEFEGHSMKSFCPVLKDANKEVFRQEGGTLAIYNHIKNFAKKVEIISNPIGTIVKTRFVNVNSGQKHFEWNKFLELKLDHITIDCREFDAVIVADFGHGLSDYFTINDGFHLMCQTNSNNFGFNRLSKWKNFKKKSVCLDLREASLQINRRISKLTDEDIKEIYNYELNSNSIYVTLGAEGSVFYDGDNIFRYPSFKTNIVDTIGAGDAFFAFSSLSESIEIPVNDRLLISSLAASLNTTWLCNQECITPEKLINHANRYL
jgi:bifunctional ADP-heptose synthase (sugar kinase/adenylyltransferase)